jgi:outer membrane protein OmpA-like peptidoglycan-associated protein
MGVLTRGATAAALALATAACLASLPGRAGSGDEDADLVRDDVDRCPATPAGAVVDARGCPSDSDRDGVFNGLDACPNTPAWALVDRLGCPLDADGDRVYDGVDQCPATPAGVAVDGHGCPVDGDGDGVPDGLDRCADTPRGAAVDATGCALPTPPPAPVVPQAAPAAPAPHPAPVLFTPERTSVTLRGVTFETGRSRLRPASYAVLDGVAAALRAAPEIRIEVAGYTDSTGSATVNQQLSEARAAAVRAYLARRGVALDRMRARGYGPSAPVASNATAAGRAQNRRVELHRID